MILCRASHLRTTEPEYLNENTHLKNYIMKNKSELKILKYVSLYIGFFERVDRNGYHVTFFNINAWGSTWFNYPWGGGGEGNLQGGG